MIDEASAPPGPILSIQKTREGWLTASSLLSAYAFTMLVAAVTRQATASPRPTWESGPHPARL